MSFTFTSCDSWLDVNNNVDAPDYISEDLYLAGILSSLGQGVAYDVRATAPLSQTFGTTNYTNYAVHFYSKSSDAAADHRKEYGGDDRHECQQRKAAPFACLPVVP